jgi:HPr kinase/phosphorylase
VSERRELIHGTCVAFGPHAALLRGPSGSGKSDLALRFLALPADGERRPALVADDQVFIEATGNVLLASPPPAIAGKLEVRGLGIIDVPYAKNAELILVVDLVAADKVQRMPLEDLEQSEIAGALLSRVALAPFEASAPLKLKLALFRAASSR